MSESGAEDLLRATADELREAYDAANPGTGRAAWERWINVLRWERFASREAPSRPDPPARFNPSNHKPNRSDQEQLLSDVLTAAFGPLRPSSVPERFKGDREALHALARRRNREWERQRQVALLRLIRRFRTPIGNKRWQQIKKTVAAELKQRADRRNVSEGGTDDRAGSDVSEDWSFQELRRSGVGDWLAETCAAERGERFAHAVRAELYEALKRAVLIGIADRRVIQSGPRDIAKDPGAERPTGRLRSAIADALAAELADDDPGDVPAPEREESGYEHLSGSSASVAEDTDSPGTEDAPNEGWLGRPPAESLHAIDRREAAETEERVRDLRLDLRAEAAGWERATMERFETLLEESPQAAPAVRRLWSYHRFEAGRRQRAVIEAMLEARSERGRWNVSKAHSEHYKPPTPDDDVGRRRFAQEWTEIQEGCAAM